VEAWVGPSEVAVRLNVSRATVYALVKSGALRHRRVGLQIRVPLSALEVFLSQQPSNSSGSQDQ
jgi:excisionase family DNA binding protein